jgi:hypothetical protein
VSVRAQGITDKRSGARITILPDQRNQRINIGLNPIKFAPDNRTLLGAIAITVFYHYMNIDIRPFTIWTGHVKLSRLNRKLFLHKRVFHNLILFLFGPLCKVGVIHELLPTPSEAYAVLPGALSKGQNLFLSQLLLFYSEAPAIAFFSYCPSSC